MSTRIKLFSAMIAFTILFIGSIAFFVGNVRAKSAPAPETGTKITVKQTTRLPTTPAPSVLPTQLMVGTQPIQIQIPCLTTGPDAVEACVLVDRELDRGMTPGGDVREDTINLAVTQLLRDKVKSFAVIYSYENGALDGAPLTVRVWSPDRNDVIVRDLNTKQIGMFWTVSRDAGHSWSKLESNYEDPLQQAAFVPMGH